MVLLGRQRLTLFLEVVGNVLRATTASLFRDLNFQKWSENGVFCTFSLRNVLRATTACTFWTSQLPKVVREWCFVHFHFEMCFAPQWRALFRHLNFQKWSENGVFCTFSLRNVLRATMACTFSTSEAPKVVRSWCVLYILTWKCASCHNGVAFSRSELPKVVREWGALHIFTSKCASRHNGVHFLDISTSKSGPRMVCFVHFHFDMCFAPQRRALFRHLNLQKWSENGVFCTFSLRNVLRATTACTFSTSQLPKVVRTWCALYILTWKCASRHNGVQFFISHLASWLRTRRFLRAYFSNLRSPKSLEKRSASRLSYLFAHLHLLSSYSSFF